MGYSSNAKEDVTSYEAIAKKFGTAFAANSNAFAQLTESNQHLGQNVAANVVDLQSQIHNLTQLVHSMAAAATRQPPNYNPPSQQFQMQQPPTMQFQMQQPPPTQQA